MKVSLSILLLCASVHASAYVDRCVDAARAVWVSAGATIPDIHVTLDKRGKNFTSRFQYGCSTVTEVSGHVTHADIIINGHVWAWKIYCFPTLIHEIGHALGLQHSTGDHDVMNPASHAEALSDGDVRALLGE